MQAKYSPADQPIHVRLTQDQTHLSLTVADFGIGIPNDKKALIFERFYRVEDSRSSSNFRFRNRIITGKAAGQQVSC